MGRNKSTLYRELARNKWFASNENESYRPYRPARLKTGPWTSPPFWSPGMVDRIATKRWRCFKPRKMEDNRLLNYTVDHLREGWSPERISGRVRLDDPKDSSMHVCHETIYAWIYQKRHDLIGYLLRAHKHRRHKHGPKAHKPKIPNRISIEKRPPEVNDRSVFGHWESDTVIGKAPSKTCLDTQVERTSRYLLCRKISDKSAPSTALAEIHMYSPLPPEARKSRTCEGGTEAALHTLVDTVLRMACYFAHPYSPGERGTNENRNGMLRRYFPRELTSRRSRTESFPMLCERLITCR